MALRIALLLAVVLATGCASTASRGVSERRFVFGQDTFAYANELLWDYEHDPATGEVTTRPRDPKPEFHHQCFVMVRATRQFFDFAEFQPESPRLDDASLKERVKAIVNRDPRSDPARRDRVVIPGYRDLAGLSADQEALLKEACGGRWQSYVQRGHWRLVFPFSDGHQEELAAKLCVELDRGLVPAIHLVRFPKLSINHAMLVVGFEEGDDEIRFTCYDPNQPAAPQALTYRKDDRRFHLPSTSYFSGGRVDVYEVYRNWLY